MRAWRSIDRFEGRSSLQSWLYRIATNVCLDMLNGRQRRARPMELTAVGTPDELAARRCRRSRGWSRSPTPACCRTTRDPAELAQAQETLRLAFVAALQHLPARQRAVLILREVLRWSAAETAELLDTSVASVNSALQRARATIADTRRRRPRTRPRRCEGDAGRAARPLRRGLRGTTTSTRSSRCCTRTRRCRCRRSTSGCAAATHIARVASRHGPRAAAARGSSPTSGANGLPAFGQYRPTGPGGSFQPWALQVIEHSNGRITGLNAFLDTARLVPALRAAARATGYRLAPPRAAARRTARRTRAAARARATLPRRRSPQPSRRAVSRRRASASTATRSAARSRTSQTTTSAIGRPDQRPQPLADERDVGVRDRRKGHDGGVGVGNRVVVAARVLGLLAQPKTAPAGKTHRRP